MASPNVVHGFRIMELKRLHIPELSLGVTLELNRMGHTGACPIATVIFPIVGRLGTKEDPIIEHNEQRVCISERQVGEFDIVNANMFTDSFPKAYGLDKLEQV